MSKEWSTFMDGDDCQDCKSYEKQIKKLKSQLDEAIKVIEFYANGAGLDLVDEGRNYMPSYKAYENDFSLENHMDQEVGERARIFLNKQRS